VAVLALIIWGPLTLRGTPLRGLAALWAGLLLAAGFLVGVLLVLGALMGVKVPVYTRVERLFRQWVAWFAPDPEALWLHWARGAHRVSEGQWSLDQALALGGREALFQEALHYLEGGLGLGGQVAGVDRLHRAALRGQPEAAFRLAEALRTGQASQLADAGEAASWYRRSALAGYGPAAAWLAWACEHGDGMSADPDKAREWAVLAQRLQPHPEPTRSPLRHDAGAEDLLVRASGRGMRHLEAAVDRALTYRGGRWGLALGVTLLAGVALVTVAAFFWAGSSQLYHMPLLLLAPPLLLVGQELWHLRRDRPRGGRDRLREAAEAGDRHACYRLGLAHWEGRRPYPKDSGTAVLWFRKAAEAGHSEAMAVLAEAYLGGHGVVRDPREAARWAEAARRESTS
jgi:hypothetical protein